MLKWALGTFIISIFTIDISATSVFAANIFIK